MKGQNFLKAMSIILILASIFALVAAGLGVVDVLDTKKVKEKEKEDTLASIQQLEDGVNMLESKRADYEAGKATYDAGIAQYDEKKAEYDAGVKKIADNTPAYEAGKVTYAEGLATYNAGLAKYNAGKTEYNTKLGLYNAGKDKYDAGLKEYKAKEQLVEQLAELNAGLDQIAAKIGKTRADGADIDGFINYQLDATKGPTAPDGTGASAAWYVANLPAQITTLEGQLAALDETDPTNEAQITTLKGTISALETNLGTAQASLSLLQKLSGGITTACASKAVTLDKGATYVTERGAMVSALVYFVPAAKDQLADANTELTAGKKTLDESAPLLAAAKAQLAAAEKQLAEGKTQLAAGKAKLDEYEAGKATLEAAKPQLEAAEKQLADGKAQLDQFEDGQKTVDAGFATLAENADVKAKIDAGMDPIVAGREVVDEQTVITTDTLMSRMYQYIALVVAAILGLVAGIMGAGAAKMPSVGKIKGGVILGALALVVAIGANVFGALKSYSDYTLQMVAMIAIAVAALLFVVAIIKYKNALVAMLSAD